MDRQFVLDDVIKAPNLLGDFGEHYESLELKTNDDLALDNEEIILIRPSEVNEDKEIVKFLPEYMKDKFPNKNLKRPNSGPDKTEESYENLELPRLKLYEKDNWNFDSYTIDDRTSVLEYIYKNHSGNIQSIEITRSDISRLKEGICLNDNMINFYLRFLEQEKLDEKLKSRILLFSSFFYEKLSQTNAETRDDRITNYMSVDRWTKNTDIFTKDFLLIPICENKHWMITIICYPRAVFDNAIADYRGIQLEKRMSTSLIFLSSAEVKIRVPSQRIKAYIETEYFTKKMVKEDRKVFEDFNGYDKLVMTWKPKVISSLI